MISLDSRPTRKVNILTQQVSGTQVLLDLGGGEYYALNEVGARVWDMCDGNQSVADITSTIHLEYDASREQIEADILELLGDLEREHLLSITS